MPTRSESVQLLIDGQFHADWSSYDVDSDLLTPADAWHVTLGPRGSLPASVAPGAPVELRVGGERVMVGRIDEVDCDVSKDGRVYAVSGRDGAAVLVDCDANVGSFEQIGLQDIVTKLVRPLGITQIRIDADNARQREKVSVEPGDSAWRALANVAEANGLWPWFDPDGTLVIGGPDYTKPPVAHLVLRTSGQGNNVIRLAERRSIHDRYSHVTVLGQARGTRTEPGRNGLKYTAEDTSVGAYRPHVVVDHEADSLAVCRDRARKLMADGRLKGYTVTATVPGHRINAPGQPSDGALWMPGQRVHVKSEPHGIDAVLFVMGRRFSGGRGQARQTTLTLKEDGAWVLDAHPHKNRHRVGRNYAAAQIVDASYGAER